MISVAPRRVSCLMRRGLCTMAADGLGNVEKEQKDEKEQFNKDKKRVVIFGGNGYVGQMVCRYALARGALVTSINRSGRPHDVERWANNVNWVHGDIFHADEWREHLNGATGVVSCVGAFGSNQVLF